MAEYRLNQQGQQVQAAIDKALALGPATSSSAGTMSAADKSKLDSMNPSNYQPLLVGSGTGQNIKTVNGQNILGPGNIDAGSSVTIDSALSSTSTNPVQNKVIYTALSGKQATLVGSGAGQNIKTINNQNILGSGNIDAGSLVTIDSALSTTSTNPVQNKVINTALGGKQETLVSGTNIKTVNGTSLLGSGNITIQGGGQDGKSAYELAVEEGYTGTLDEWLASLQGVGFQSVSSQQDGTIVITLSSGDTVTIDLNHNHPMYPKYVYLTSESQMPASPDSSTLYLIAEQSN